MCDIGQPVEIIVVDPLNLPAPIPGREVEPEPRQPLPAPVVVPVTIEQ